MRLEPEVPGLPFGRPLTHGDLLALPPDGHRYEVLDGSLLVTPTPDWDHQHAVVELVFHLRRSCPFGLEVLVAPFDVVLAEDTALRPDLVVLRADDYDRRGERVVPRLVVEVLSPHTRRIDLTAKRTRYEAAGCPAYWVLDPVDASLTAWEMGVGGYVIVGQAVGYEPLRVDEPFPITLVPDQLVRRAQ